MLSHQIACKDTTKNAHTQESEKLFAKKIDFIYLIRYTALAQASLKAKWWIADGKVQTIFANNFERTGVCTASCERTFGVKECDGTHSEYCARRVPTLRIERNT